MKLYQYLVFCLLALCLQVAAASSDTDLLTAVKSGNVNAMQRSLAAGANPNQADDKGTLPLMWAAYQGNLAIVNALLNAGANINVACANLNLLPEEPIKYRDTPLGLAVSNGHLQVVQTLIAKGANLNSENNLRRPALLLAVQSGNITIVQTLLNAGANPNAKGGLEDSTPLIEAVKNGNQALTDLLVKAGAEINVTNNNGDSALTLAKQNGLSTIISTLKTKGAIEAHPLPIKIPMMVLLFFIPFIFTVNIIPALLPNMNPIATQASSFIIACALSASFVAVAWQAPLSTFDSIRNEMFDGFIGVIAGFISLLFFIIGVYLFFKHITALFRG